MTIMKGSYAQIMSKFSKMRGSRNNWKGKAVERADEVRYVRKENNRLRKDRDKYKNIAKEAEQKLKELQGVAMLPSVSDKSVLVFLVLQLFCLARIGFRAISRVLNVFSPYLGLKKIPCPQTVINWVIRLSIYRSQNIGCAIKGFASSGYIWMIDTSIALGSAKILAVIAIRADHYNRNSGAPTLKDVHCVAVSVAVSWTGEAIAALLQQIIEVMGIPIAFLKDGGKDLAKAAKILAERGYKTFSIDDLSHVVAILLKHEYGKHPLFEVFISTCGNVSKKLKQTILASVAPPKVSTKSRFMNLHRLVVWAGRLLNLSPKGRAKKGGIIEKLRNSFDRLPECRSFIKRFLRDAEPLLEIQKILKNKGLDKDTGKECEVLLSTIPPSSPVRIGMMEWLNKHLEIAEKIASDSEDLNLPISSDAIESLFGVSKRHGTGTIKDANRIAARIPALCGSLTMEDAYGVLNVSVEQQKQTVDNLPSLIKQRRRILPNPENIEIENDLAGDSDQYLQLIPGAKIRSKNDIKPHIPRNHEKATGPP